MTRSTAALLSLFVSLAVPAGAIAEPQWRMVRSPNFVVLGDAGEKPLQDVAMRLEQFRTALGRVLPGVELATPVPTVLVVFESSKSYEAFGPRREGRPVQAAGFFLAGPDVNYITLTLDSGHDGLRVAFHEYSHLILHNWMASVPAWLDEGLAEYYSTFQLATNGKSATIGLAIPHHAGLLRERFMPLSDLLAVDRQSSVYNEGDQRTLFYAGSWALTHYLLMETPKGDAKIARYLALVAGGETVDRAVQQAFEMPPAALERLLRRLRQSGRLPVCRIHVPESRRGGPGNRTGVVGRGNRRLARRSPAASESAGRGGPEADAGTGTRPRSGTRASVGGDAEPRAATSG